MTLETNSASCYTSASSVTPQLHWTESGQTRSAGWRSERGAAPPARVQLADDTVNADAAYKLACEGTALLWRGDFQNARQLLQALVRRVDRTAVRPSKKSTPSAAPEAKSQFPAAFHRMRQVQAQRAQVLGMLLVELDAQYRIALRRAPDVAQACTEAWGAADAAAALANGQVVSLRELLGVVSASEWRKKGVEIPALGPADSSTDGPTYDRIHAHYGVFSPVRGEYLALVARAPLPVHSAMRLALDIGTGTGVIAALLARRGLPQVVATDTDARALACAQDNINRLGVAQQVQVLRADLFPPAEALPAKASVIVCNPPWLPGRAHTSLEAAVYDEGSRMLLGFLQGAASRLAPGGEAWLVLSDLAERLGLRTRDALLAAIEAGGLKVLARLDTKPVHPKAQDASDPLHKARASEITSLWRLGVAR